MPNLLALRFSKVGFSEARIDGLGYGLARDGEARNSLVCTGNGGGKTTQVHLLFSLFLPQKYDLMTHKDNTGRRFEYYFEENEIAFIASEWSIPNSQASLAGRPKTRVVGRFTQFTNREKYEHETYFFSFIADDDLGIDDLPITSSIPHRVRHYCRTVSEAKKYLKETFDKPGREFFGPSEKMENWQNYLRSLGFNIEVFRLMQMFTMSEGDPGAFLNRYCSQEAVLGLITKEVMDANSTARLRDMLVQHRDSVNLAPTTRAQIAAYNALWELFCRMEPVAARLIEAEGSHQEALVALGTVAARIAATLALESERLASLKAMQAEEQESLAVEKKQLVDLQAELRGVVERLAALAAQAAKEEYRRVVELFEEKTRLVAAVRALVDRVEVMELQSKRDDLARQLDALAEPTRSLADELAMAEELLAEYLGKDRESAAAKVKRLESEEKQATVARKAMDEEIHGVKSKLAEQRTEALLLKRVEEERLSSLASLPPSEYSAGEDVDPAQLVKVLEAEQARLGERRDAAQAGLSELKTEVGVIGADLKQGREKLEELKKDHGRAVAGYLEYRNKHDTVVSMRGMADVFGLQTPEPFLQGLQSKLKGCVASCESDIRKLEGEIASREERIGEIERNGGLLPSSKDVETVLDALRSAKLDAHSYWHVFSQQNRSPEESERELRKDPFRVGGVAVSGTKAVEKAREILAACAVLAPVAVTDYSVAIGRQQEGEGFVLLPDAALAIDRKEAARFCETASSEIASRKTTIAVINAARDAAAEARDALVSFLGAYNETSAELFKVDIARVENAMANCQSEIGTLAERQAVAADLLRTTEADCLEMAEKMKRIDGLLIALREHVARFEHGREERLRQMYEISAAIGRGEETVGGMAERLAVLERMEAEARAAAGQARSYAAGVQSEICGLGGVRKCPTAAFRTLATNTASARELHRGKSRALESANANAEYIQMQAQHGAAKKNYEDRQARWEKQHGGLSAQELDEGRKQLAGEAAAPEDLESMETVKNGVFEARVRAEQTADRLSEEERQRQKDHLGLPVIPSFFDSDEALERRTALTGAIEQLAATVEARGATIGERKGELERAEGRSQLLAALVPDVALPADGDYPPYVNPGEAREEVANAKSKEKAASREVTTLGSELNRFNLDLAELLDSDLCAPVAQMGFMIKEEQRRCGGILKEDLQGFLDRIHNAIESLKFELSQHEKNEQKVVEQVVLDVKKAFGYLSKLAGRSRVPALGGIWAEWSGRPFIQFRTRVEIDSEASRQAIADTVATISQVSGELPTGDVIIHTALSAVLGKAYIIETLKPDSSPTTVYKGIEHPTGLNAWSGGERLSGAVLFYLAVCNLLTVDGQGGNVMLLDNPFGSCTNTDFIRLIIALTRQYGVQIVAYTPTENEDIRRLFPLNIMIRKGGADGIVKSTGKPLVKYEKTVYHEGEITTLEITREVPHATA